MDVLVLGKAQQVKVTSVVLSHEKDEYGQKRLKMFFCWNCQNPMFQYVGRAIAITPGETPYTLPIILKCKRCNNTIQLVDIV